jgi:hypothetical protein
MKILPDDEIFMIILLISVFILGVCLGAIFMKLDIQQEAIEAGSAEYDQKTGKFQFIKVEVKE